jgi:hypothetical protein
MFGRGFGASRIVATVEVSGDGKAGLSCGGTNEVENLLIAVAGFAGPVLGDLRKETMLDGCRVSLLSAAAHFQWEFISK